MKRYSIPVAAAALLAAFSMVESAGAQETAPVAQPVVVAPPAYAARDTVTYEETTPNAAFIASGTIMFGLAYGASVVVAATSDRTGDEHLYVPLAGPWIDLADRGGCPPTDSDCDSETTNKVLLVADGVFQGLGALQIVSGFLFPTRKIVTTASAPALHVAPTLSPSRLGLTALGTF